jgi:multidrug efflux pump subunit AcrB
MTSDTLPLSTVDDYGENLLAQRLSMVNGVAQVFTYGPQTYAVRVQLDPNAMASRGLGIDEVETAVQKGNVNLPTGTLYGNLYVSGRDPMFNLEHGVALSHELNRMGIRNVTGDLVVTDNFVMNYSANAQKAVSTLQSSIDASKRNAATVKAWQNYLTNSGRFNQVTTVPSVALAGGVYVQSIPTNAKLLFAVSAIRWCRFPGLPEQRNLAMNK